MKEHKDEQWLDETISRATELGSVKFDAEKWREQVEDDRRKQPHLLPLHVDQSESVEPQEHGYDDDDQPHALDVLAHRFRSRERT